MRCLLLALAALAVGACHAAPPSAARPALPSVGPRVTQLTAVVDTATDWPGWQTPVDLIRNDTVGTGLDATLVSLGPSVLSSVDSIYHNLMVYTGASLGVDSLVYLIAANGDTAIGLAIVTVQPTPPATDASITLSASFLSGHRVDLRVTERNLGSAPLEAAVFTTDTISGLVFKDQAQNRCVGIDPGAAYCYRGELFGSIAPGGTRSFSVRFQAAQSRRVTFRAHYLTVSPDPVPANNAASLTVTIP